MAKYRSLLEMNTAFLSKGMQKCFLAEMPDILFTEEGPVFYVVAIEFHKKPCTEFCSVPFFRPPCKIAFSPNLCVIVKILSSEYQLYACGKIFPMP